MNCKKCIRLPVCGSVPRDGKYIKQKCENFIEKMQPYSERGNKKDWSEYPIGTRAHAVMGGYWLKVVNGWKWAEHGDTFPTPGGDVSHIEEPKVEEPKVEEPKPGEDPIDRAIRVLNEALILDPDAISALMLRQRVKCNDALMDHPTIQVGVQGIRTLGLINGLFGTTKAGRGFITMVLDCKGEIVRFERSRND